LEHCVHWLWCFVYGKEGERRRGIEGMEEEGERRERRIYKG
jgi:hypothetical protein